MKAVFTPSVDSFDFSLGSPTSNPGKAAKSLKSMRTYQLGVVYRDRYGRAVSYTHLTLPTIYSV